MGAKRSSDNPVYRMPGGLGWDELQAVIRQALETGKVRGMNITICNPALDESGEIARAFSDTLAAALGRGVAT